MLRRWMLRRGGLHQLPLWRRRLQRHFLPLLRRCLLRRLPLRRWLGLPPGRRRRGCGAGCCTHCHCGPGCGVCGGCATKGGAGCTGVTACCTGCHGGVGCGSGAAVGAGSCGAAGSGATLVGCGAACCGTAVGGAAACAAKWAAGDPCCWITDHHARATFAARVGERSHAPRMAGSTHLTNSSIDLGARGGFLHWC